MPPLGDEALLERLLEALEGWRYDGYIDWKPRATAWLRKNLPGCSQKAIGRAMYSHVTGGGAIYEAKENYEGYRDDHPFHYDYRILVAGKRIYIETVFDDKRMGPTITVVNIKYAQKS